MTRRLKLRTALAAALAAATTAAIAPSTAPAATQVIGSPLNLSYQGGVCNANCLSVQSSLAVSPHPLVSPANGVIDHWRVRSGDPNTLYTLRMMTPQSGNGYIVTNSVQAPALTPPGITDSIFSYPGQSAPIMQGQAIGLLQTGAAVNGLPQRTTNGITANVITNIFSGNFNDGLGATGIPDAQHELLLQATIRFCRVPNVLGQQQAAAQAALAAAECGSSVTGKPRRKKSKRGKVLKQKIQPDETVAPGTVVELVVGTKKGKKKGRKKK